LQDGSGVQMLAGLCRDIRAAGSLDEALDACVRALVDRCGLTWAAVSLPGDDGVHLQERARHGRPESGHQDGESRHTFPLHAGEADAGVLEVCPSGGRRLTDDELAMMETLAGHLALVIERTWRETSERRRADREKEQLLEQLLQTEKLSAIGQLISGVAHELNNPLTGVIAYAQLLSARDCEEPIKQGLQKVHVEAKRCHRIVQNLLTFARKHAPCKSLVHLHDILESTIELRAYQLRVDNVRVVMDLARDVPRTMADFHQLQQVFMNLVNNAHQAIRDAGRGGTLRVTTRAARGRIRVTIQDDGPGIPAENLSRIFDPFFTTKPSGQGTGLGLSICFGIVQEHLGKIVVRSAEGRGASFIVDLPVLGPTGEEAAAAEEASADDVPAAEQARVLVVDDEPSIVDVLAEALKACGHTVDTAANGRVALRKLMEGDYDLVLSDLKMPEMNGQDLFREATKLRPELARRFVFATGDVMGGDTRDFLQWAGSPYVEKPFHVDKLVGMLQSILAAPS
jgi:two-component system, NtrC family, sensor kinase